MAIRRLYDEATEKRHDGDNKRIADRGRALVEHRPELAALVQRYLASVDSLYNLIYSWSMSLEPILLGLLETPASGYDLKKVFDHTVRHFWNAELSQIYPTLHRLRRAGFVVSSKKPSAKGPDREVYSRTPLGTEKLRSWLASGAAIQTERLAFLGQLFFMGQADDLSLTRSLLQRLRTRFADRLEILRSIDEQARLEEPSYPDRLKSDEFHEYLTLRCGLTRIAASLDWCDESLQLLDEFERRQKTERSPGRAEARQH